MHEDLTIDRNVRDWVFFPLMIAIVLMNVLRQLAHQVNSQTPSTSAVRPVQVFLH
jgi:hypothetical protein